ncbi:MAG: Rrf2 family transcriptional regulator [Chthonomonadales bacterium]
MQSNSRLAVAIHILTLLAFREGEQITSEYIASSVMTNPVVIRRILGMLRKAGLVTSHKGNTGGWQLAKPIDQISLLDAHAAVKPGPAIALPLKEPNARCCIGKGIRCALIETFDDVEQVMMDRLSGITIADILNRVEGVSLSQPTD